MTDYGYHVNTFRDGLQAFAEFEKNPDRFDLIVTDMTMPGMTGLELSQKVLELRPHQQIFLCTGFSEAISEEKALELGITGYFEKPIIVENMLNVIRSSLDDKSTDK